MSRLCNLKRVKIHFEMSISCKRSISKLMENGKIWHKTTHCYSWRESNWTFLLELKEKITKCFKDTIVEFEHDWRYWIVDEMTANVLIVSKVWQVFHSSSHFDCAETTYWTILLPKKNNVAGKTNIDWRLYVQGRNMCIKAQTLNIKGWPTQSLTIKKNGLVKKEGWSGASWRRPSYYLSASPKQLAKFKVPLKCVYEKVMTTIPFATEGLHFLEKPSNWPYTYWRQRWLSIHLSEKMYDELSLICKKKLKNEDNSKYFAK